MTARETIENLWDRAVPIAPLLDQYAHELAEKIRKESREWDGWPDHQNSMNIAADLIDPELEN